MASGQTVAADGSSRMAHCGWHMARLHSPAVSTWKMATYRLGSGQGQVPQLVQEVHPRDGRDRSQESRVLFCSLHMSLQCLRGSSIHAGLISQTLPDVVRSPCQCVVMSGLEDVADVAQTQHGRGLERGGNVLHVEPAWLHTGSLASLALAACGEGP